MYEKIKGILAEDTVFYSVLILLIGVSSFGLGRWSMAENTPVSAHSAGIQLIENTEMKAAVAEATAAENLEFRDAAGSYVASKNGTKYHLPWCPGAKQMKEENKIWFDSKPAAEAAGYTPAANCKGI